MKMITVAMVGKIISQDMQVHRYVTFRGKWDFEDEIKNLEMERESLKSKIERKS